jgi:predicted N-acetyltransferase YhbS
MGRGVGRALVTDAVARARAAGAGRLEVVAQPAAGFYAHLGFADAGPEQTLFGPARRLGLDL